MPDEPNEFTPLGKAPGTITDKDVTLSSLKAKVSVASIFATYLRTGDRFRTAAAHNLSVEQVTDLAVHEGWDKLLGQRNALTEQGGSTKTREDTNRELVRLRIASQADRLSGEINAVLDHLESLSKEEKEAYLFEVDRTGKKTPTAKLYLDLTKALQALAEVSLRAEGDQLPQRPDAGVIDGKEFAKNLGVGMAGAVMQLSGASAGAATPKREKQPVTLPPQ